jgi:hypothetical protein
MQRDDSLHEDDRKRTKETLVAMGAPLAGWMARVHVAPEQALATALQLALDDATLLRVFPVVLAKNWKRLDWNSLADEARERSVLELLGMLVELTGQLTQEPKLSQKANAWWSPTPKLKFLFAPRNRFDRELAEHGSLQVAKKWGFLVNLGEDSFRSLLERHLG